MNFISQLEKSQEAKDSIYRAEKKNFILSDDWQTRRFAAIKLKYLKFILIKKTSVKENYQKIKLLYEIIALCTKKDFEIKAIAYSNLHYIVSPISKKYAEIYINKTIENAKLVPNFYLTPYSISSKAILYLEKKQFDKAIQSFARAYKYFPDDDFLHQASMYNNISLCYFKLENFEKQLYYLSKAFQKMELIEAPTREDITFKNILVANKADYFVAIGQYEKAKINYLEVFLYFRNNGLINEASEIYNSFNNLIKNQPNTQFQNYIVQDAFSFYNEVSYQNKYFINQFLLTYLRSNSRLQSIKLIQKNEQILSEILIDEKKNASLLYDAFLLSLEENISKKNNLIVNKHKLEILQKNQSLTFLILLFGLLVTTIYIYIKSKNNKVKSKARLAVEKAKVEKLKKDALENDLSIKDLENKQLQLNLLIKNEAEQTFFNELKKLKKHQNIKPEEIISSLQVKISQLLEIDKRNFSDKLDGNLKIEKIRKIHSLYPSLTKLEQKLLLYFTLNMSTKEMSSILEMSEGSIRVYKNRIKNKVMPMDKDITFNELIESI